MRASQWLLAVATTAATAACVAAGCGGSTSSGGNKVTDSGVADVVAADHVTVMVAAPEAAMEAASDSPPPCASDAQITSIPVPEGSVPGSDASAAACLSCVEMACPNLIMECNAICGCPQAFQMFESCVNAGGNVETCGEMDLLSAGLQLTQLECAIGCVSTCGITLEGGATETGTGEGGSGEGGAEAAADSSSDATGQ